MFGGSFRVKLTNVGHCPQSERFLFDVTLTFDNGPEPDVTPGVLRTLASHDIRTTFFVLGQNLADPARRALSAEAAAQGHWIANHTYTHSVPLGLRKEPGVAQEEIGRTQALIGDLSHPDKFFRPFGGGGHLDRRLLNQETLEFLTQGGFTVVLWNCVPGDFKDPDGWVETALKQVEQQAWPLMVLHDLPNGASRHLDRFLGTMKDRGARFRQDFPEDCLPIRRGNIARPVDAYVAAAA
jgi:peptidoglycan-N-acetylglucosamine deacetylase